MLVVVGLSVRIAKSLVQTIFDALDLLHYLRRFIDEDAPVIPRLAAPGSDGHLSSPHRVAVESYGRGSTMKANAWRPRPAGRFSRGPERSEERGGNRGFLIEISLFDFLIQDL